MFNSNDNGLSNECLLVIFGSIVTYYMIRLVFRIAQNNNPNYPIEQYRTPTDEAVELWTIGALAGFMCISLMMTRPTLGAWLSLFIGLFAGTVAGFGQRSGALLEMAGLERSTGQVMYGSGSLLLFIGLLMGSFYFIILLRGVQDRMPYILSVGIMVFIYIGWVFTRQTDMPYIMPWWWLIIGTLFLINSLRQFDDIPDGIGMFIVWALWGSAIGIMASQGLTFWGGTQWFQFIGSERAGTNVNWSESQLIQLIRQQLGFVMRRTSSVDNMTEPIAEVKEEMKQLKWGIQFLIFVPLLLGTWWWMSTDSF